MNYCTTTNQLHIFDGWAGANSGVCEDIIIHNKNCWKLMKNFIVLCIIILTLWITSNEFNLSMQIHIIATIWQLLHLVAVDSVFSDESPCIPPVASSAGMQSDDSSYLSSLCDCNSTCYSSTLPVHTANWQSTGRYSWNRSLTDFNHADSVTNTKLIGSVKAVTFVAGLLFCDRISKKVYSSSSLRCVRNNNSYVFGLFNV